MPATYPRTRAAGTPRGRRTRALTPTRIGSATGRVCPRNARSHRRSLGPADAVTEEVDVFHLRRTLADQCDTDAEHLAPFAGRYGEDAPDEPDRLHSHPFQGSRQGGLGLLRDLHDLYLMAAECAMAWTLVGRAAKGLRDEALLTVVEDCEQHTTVQLKWLRTRMKQAAPQALIVAE
jgi:hypothetical protein